MSFFDSISKFFGFGRETVGKWPRVVGLNELPPERLPILPEYLRPRLPFGLREVTGPNHEGWQPWQPRQVEQRSRRIDNNARGLGADPSGGNYE